MTLESGKIIRKRRGWRKRGGLELHGFVLTPYPIPLVFFLLTSPCKDSPQCERLEYARFIRGADQQKAATNICTIIKWKESKERAWWELLGFGNVGIVVSFVLVVFWHQVIKFEFNAQRNVNFIDLWKRKENDEKKGFCTKKRSLALRT